VRRVDNLLKFVRLFLGAVESAFGEVDCTGLGA
jgi:hypothetical protein